MKHTYIAIDLKSFYASVECVERGLNPLTTNLVVADESRTEKTICLAVSPSLKKYGIPGRGRLFEVNQKAKEVNLQRQSKLRGKSFVKESYDEQDLLEHPDWKLSFIAARPRMAMYLEYSTRIHEIYLKYISPEDLHVYSIDEVFIDASGYLNHHHITAKELTRNIILDILQTTGITATAGIGNNLYLCKVALDIISKHIEPDEWGIRIAEIDEMSYRKLLWDHKPIIDFWRVGRGYVRRLKEIGIETMGDIARCSLGKPEDAWNEEVLYRLFGINAELLIDHAWGYESCTMEAIKSYQPSAHSIGTGQVLSTPYSYEKAKLIAKEMLDTMALELVDKGFVTDQIILMVGYDIENLSRTDHVYHGEITTDFYGRKLPKHAHGSVKLPQFTASSKLMINAVMELFERIVDPSLTVRRVNIAANHIVAESMVDHDSKVEQFDLFTDYDQKNKADEALQKELMKEKKLQLATVEIKKKFGKNAILKGMNLEEGANARERNQSIGGHKA